MIWSPSREDDTFCIDDQWYDYHIVVDEGISQVSVSLSEKGTLRIRSPRPMTRKRVRALLAREADRIRGQAERLNSLWDGGSWPLAGGEIPYTVVINSRRKEPCAIAKRSGVIVIETPTRMTRKECEKFLGSIEDWLRGYYQKHDSDGAFADGMVEIDGEEIPFYVSVNRRRKRTTFVIREDLAIEIRSPSPLSHDAALSLLRRESDWIRNARPRKEEIVRKMPVQEYDDGATILFQGRTLTIHHNRGGDGYIAYIVGDELYLCIPEGCDIHDERGRIAQAVIRCYSSAILPIAEQIAEETAEAIGVPMPRIRFGYQKRRFGSCTQRNGIILNIRLAQAPPGYLEYTIVHEVCHLREAHHQKQFWELVESVLPEYQTLHANLQKEGMRYAF